VNGWTTEIEMAQNVSLSLEGAARDVLKDVSPTSLTPYIFGLIWHEESDGRIVRETQDDDLRVVDRLIRRRKLWRYLATKM